MQETTEVRASNGALIERQAPRFQIAPYGSRHHAVYDGTELVAVCCYLRGAKEVAARLTRLHSETQQCQCGASR